MVETKRDADGLERDRRLAERVVEGDEAAFEELVGLHHRQVARISGRFFRRPELVEEVCQEVFVKAFIGMRTYRAEQPLEHWMARVTVNTCYDQLRQRRHEEMSLSQVVENPVDFYDRLPAPDGSPEAEFWGREEGRMCAEQMLARLGATERLVLTLMVLEDLSVEEVSKLTGWSKANVKIRAFRARAKLRELLTRPKRAGTEA
ncbi:MAG: RNA polymerase sigma factor [Acidobacteriota bacterium]